MDRALSVEHEPWLRYTPFQRWLFLAVLMLIGTSAAIDKGLLPILFQPIKAEFQLSDGMLGLLGGAPFAICFALSSIPLARLADRGGRKGVLLMAMAGWSVMTALCGLAPTLALLFVARMGVGLAEGGSYPPSHALLADYFPLRQRGLAFALYTVTASIGYLIASSVGGWLATRYGWRTAFLATGIAAIPVALLALVVLRDSRSVIAAGAMQPQANVTHDLQTLFGKRTFRLVVVALMFFAVYPYGLVVFTPSYMVRLFGLDLAQAGPQFGLAIAIGQLFGSILGGLLVDRLRLRDERWLLKLPGFAVLASFFLAIGAFTVENVMAFLVLSGLGIATVSAALPSAFAVVQHVCGNRRRATASAIAIIVYHAIGMTVSPLLIGWLSDAFHDAAGAHSLRYGMLAVCPLLIVAVWAFFAAARSLHIDRDVTSVD